MTSRPAARSLELVKTYGSGDATVHALAGVTVQFEVGAYTAIMGPSGSGKSTLMNVMAGLDSATDGAGRGVALARPGRVPSWRLVQQRPARQPGASQRDQDPP